MTAAAASPDPDVRRTVVWLLVVTILFIVHASLYPFDFDPQRVRDMGVEGWMKAMTWRKAPRSDLIANLIFYLPLGALLAYLAPRDWTHPRRWIFSVACATLLSLLIECLQTLTVDRDPSLTDVTINGFGAALAAAAALTARTLGMRPSLPALRVHQPDPVAVLLIAVWFAFHAAPLMPSTRLIRYLRDPTSLFDSSWTPAAVAGFVAGYVILGAALRHLLRARSFWPAVAVCALASLAARLSFRGQRLELNEVLGLALAIPVLWQIWRHYDARTLGRATVCVAGALLLFALLPFDFAWQTPVIGLAPGLRAIHRTLAGEPGILELSFLYLGLMWLLAESKIALRTATPWVLVAAVVIEAVQTLQPGRGAQLLGPVILIIGALLVGLTRRVAIPSDSSDGQYPLGNEKG
jgi:VanZ family protein